MCSSRYNQHPLCVAKNIVDFYGNFANERWTLMELLRLDSLNSLDSSGANAFIIGASPS